jgi:hypothetical protein
MKYNRGSDCCKSKVHRVRDWIICVKCKKRCFWVKISTDNTRENKVDKGRKIVI